MSLALITLGQHPNVELTSEPRRRLAVSLPGMKTAFTPEATCHELVAHLSAAMRNRLDAGNVDLFHALQTICESLELYFEIRSNGPESVASVDYCRRIGYVLPYFAAFNDRWFEHAPPLDDPVFAVDTNFMMNMLAARLID